MNERIVSRQYVQGTSPAFGGPRDYQLVVPCTLCHYTTTMQTVSGVPNLELVITQRQEYGGGPVVTTFSLMDPTNGCTVNSMMHTCFTTTDFANDVPGMHDHDHEMLDIMRRMDQRLATRLAGEVELERLRGTVVVLKDRLEIVEEELTKSLTRNVKYAQQLTALHESLDCPCEMPLDSNDLIAHMKEMDIGLGKCCDR